MARRLNNYGYVLIKAPDHPNANLAGYVFEHRLVVSEKLGRPLLREENVHHIDGDRKNNDPRNLEVWGRKQPAGQRMRDLVRLAIVRGEYVEYAEGECPFA